MRGAGDLPLGPTTNIDLLERVIDSTMAICREIDIDSDPRSAQRNIISSVFNTTDQTKVPQVWCMLSVSLNGVV